MTQPRTPPPRSPVATLFPGYFALVMATGIVAIAAELHDLGLLADVLYGIAAASYVVLGALLATRIARYRDLFWADATDHAKGFAFLTTVAGTNVLAAASIVIHDWWELGQVLWWIGAVGWVVTLYPTLVAVVVVPEHPTLTKGINGTWFLLTVSTQSIAVTAGLLLTRSGSDLLAFTALAAFGLGLVLYLIVMTLVFLRWIFYPFEPTELDPPAWIASGAVAITVLAGSNLIIATTSATGAGSERLARVAPFLEGLVVTTWATATFWFPLMVALGVWRHLVRRVPLRYHPSYWSMVFPLGMYSVATYRLRVATDLEALGWLPAVVLAIALTAWAATFAGMLHSFARSVRGG